VGLAFVYLLLSLICSAVNEYISSLLNMRGRVLVDGLNQLLQDTGLEAELFKHPLVASHFPHRDALKARAKRIESWPRGTRWIYRFVTWLFKPSVRSQRYPSYLSPRAFATAFLDITGYLAAPAPPSVDAASPAQPVSGGGDARPPTPTRAPARAADTEDAGASADTAPDTGDATASANTAADTGDADAPASTVADDGGSSAPDGKPKTGETLSGATPVNPGKPAEVAPVPAKGAEPNAVLRDLLAALERDSTLESASTSPLDLLRNVPPDILPEHLRQQINHTATAARDQAVRMQASVEGWFNSSMDRVSGAYKRHTQHALLFIALVISLALNADTLDLWRRLSTDDKLRDGIAMQASNALPGLAVLASDTAQPAPSDSAATDTTRIRIARARLVYDSANAALERTTLNFGWGWEDAVRLGLAVRLDSAASARRQRAQALAALNSKSTRDDTLRANAPRPPLPQPQYNFVGLHGDLRGGAIFSKLIGVLLTMFALSLGAPFWFDLLNKIVNLRAAGRAPETKPKS
jgi:hypothetical protein